MTEHECRFCGWNPKLSPEEQRWADDGDPGDPIDLFETTDKLAVLLCHYQVFISSQPKTSTGQAPKWLFALCNDIFAWSCADAELLDPDQIDEVYDYWRHDPAWGVAKWCMWQRQEQPQEPVREVMRENGSWESWCDQLKKNSYDQAMKQLRRETERQTAGSNP